MGQAGKIAGRIYLPGSEGSLCDLSCRKNRRKILVKISEEKLRPMLGESSKVHYMYTEEICGLRPSELKDKNVISKYRNKNYRPYYCTYVTFNQNQGEISAISADRQQQNRYRGCLFSSGYISGKRAHYLIGDMSRNRAEYLELDAADNAIRLYKLDLSRTKKEKHPFYKLPDQIGFSSRKAHFLYTGERPYLYRNDSLSENFLSPFRMGRDPGQSG